MTIHFLAIDGFNLIRRVFEARKPESEAALESVIEAATASVRRELSRHSPTHAAVVLEGHDLTWRHLLDAEYKANRSETPPLLLDHLNKFEQSFLTIGVISTQVESYEADDILATIATVVADNRGIATIVSTDKIFGQLLRPGIVVYDHFSDVFQNVASIGKRFDVRPDQLIDFFAMAGDRTNNIKGVPGVGPKAAVMLLNHFGTLDAILAVQADDASAQVNLSTATLNALAKVQSNADLALKCRQLVTLKTDVALGLNLKTFRLPQH